ncbi:MAG: ribosomal-processing cysteine protease Prp [Clostridia bacterium]|nr:ribosomal-processing cysteine protease Prp [Clostridia bacterium]
MIRATILARNDRLCGFEIQGHAGYAEQGRDIVCAAVSSAAYLTANTLTEVCGCRAKVQENEGRLSVVVSSGEEEAAQIPLKGLQLHLEGLCAQYSTYIQLQLTEV